MICKAIYIIMFINNSDKKVHFFLPDIIHSEVMVSTKFHEKPSKELRMILQKSLHIILFRCVPSMTFTVQMIEGKKCLLEV